MLENNTDGMKRKKLRFEKVNQKPNRNSFNCKFKILCQLKNNSE